MKMTLGTGLITDYGSYTNNCTKDQWPYKIPVASLSDVQLYIDIGGLKPDAIQYELLHTCGIFYGTVETLSTSSYLIGQKSDDYWYGVFKNLTGANNPLSCFVIAITLTFGTEDKIYFSEEYCIESCDPLIEIKGCYGNLDTLISTDRQGIYFGTHAGSDTALGNQTIVYEHKLKMRSVELMLSSLKKTYKQGRTRNFRTETEDIYQFTGEFVPEWYIREVGSVFDRGEVFIGGVKYLVDGFASERIEDCKRVWRPAATVKESYYQSFSCEADPCLPPSITLECCDPSSITVTVQFTPTGVCCDPEIIVADIQWSETPP